METQTFHPPAHIERWTMRLQPYGENVVYRVDNGNPAGNGNPLDTTVRSNCEENIAGEYISFVSINGILQAMCLSEVQSASQSDFTFQALMSSLQGGKWHFYTNVSNIDLDRFKSLKQVNDELSGCNIVPLRRPRIVIPSSLLKRSVRRLAHESHQGIVKTKVLIREKILFPGIDSMGHKIW